jgi:ABC-type nitrate/sulfonate/bicarbonate transport system substrate-binding protein
MKNYKFVIPIVILAALVVGLLSYRSCQRPPENEQTITVAMAPYQDMAMLVNIQNLGLEKKYGLKVNLNTMDWENIVPSIASSGQTADIGFASYIEYLNKEKNLNTSGDDPVLFIYPAYIFKGGAFVTFKQDVPALTSDTINNSDTVRTFLSKKIGAQKSSVYEMMIFSLARRANIAPGSLNIIDTPLNDGILAAQSGSLDIAEAGLTQMTEARKQGGRVILTMEDLGFADITGFICKKSTLEKKRVEIEKLIKMWFESVQYVMNDLDHNSSYSLKYLDSKASTKYTLQQYKEALSQEYFPVSVDEANNSIVSDTGKYSYRRIGEDVTQYLLQVKKVSQAPTKPSFITIQPR